MMKKLSRHILSVLLLTVLCSCDSSPQSQIEQVLRADKKIGDKLLALVPRNNPTDGDLAQYALAVQDSVKHQRDISLSGCPADFITAYVEHVRAWEDFGDTLKNRPQIPTGMEALVGGFIRGMMGDITGGAGEIQANIQHWVDQLKEAEGRIKTSWRNVEDAAIRHGAQLP
jgi:hypothetical protein